MTDPHLPHPWYRHATLYQIYPLSFADSNADGFGDLRGIINHLDYLNDGTAESLGVQAVWLSPIYRSPMADWGYDVVDHCAVDPKFGTLADFDELVAELHGRGMKLLLDFVPNHTSQQHAWFKASRSSRDNDKRDWYIWADPQADGSPPNNWLSILGTPAWAFDEATGQYYLHTFLAEQPDLNWRNPEVREAMLDVLRFWLRRGVDGFRTDAVYGLIKDTGLRDNPPNPNFQPGISAPVDALLPLHSAGQPELNGVIGAFCDVLDEGGGSFLVSEVYLNIPGMQQLYKACAAHPLHAPFNFNLLKLPWSAGDYRSFIDEYEASLGPDDWPNYVLGNHDRTRLVSRLGVQRARLAAMLQLTLRGLPVIYAGEELGLTDGEIAPEQMRDTFGRRASDPRLGRDPERTPLPWSGGHSGGFTTGEPWLPLAADYRRANVEVEERDPESFLALYRHLIQLRASSPALTEGDYRSLGIENSQVFAYVREAGRQRYCVLLNFSHREQSLKIGKIGRWVAGTRLVEGDGEICDNGTVTLAGYEGRVYELRRGDGDVSGI